MSRAREGLKAVGLSLWQVVTPRRTGRSGSTAVTSRNQRATTMKKGNDFPAAAPPTDRFAVLRSAQQRHENAVREYEEAQRQFVEAVNALDLPELMQGPIVRVTDADSIQKVRIVLDLADDPRDEYLLEELSSYRAERERLAEWYGIADLAELVAVTAAAVARAGRA